MWIPTVAGAITLAACGGGGDEGGRPPATATGQAPAQQPTEAQTTTSAPPTSTQSAPADPYSESAAGEEPDVLESVRAYVKALNERDGKSVCGLIAPQALREVKLPAQRGSCATSVSASIGFAGPGGTWKNARIARVRSVELQPGNRSSARVGVTIVSRFRDGREPSIEDDLIYLAAKRGGWQIVKPSAVFYRAIGVPNAPLSVLAPP